MTFSNLHSRLFTLGRNLARNLAGGLSLGLAVLTADLAAQQVVCFSFDGVKTASGKDNTSAGSKTGVRVGGKTVMIDTKPGDSPATCASKLDAALKKAGFKTKKASSTVVCVEAGPGGVPLTSGGGIGTTDTGLTGIDVSVMKPPKSAPPPKIPPKKPVKQQGATVPQVKPGQTASRDGWIQIDVEVYRWQNGKWVLITIQVQIKIKKGETSQQINQKIHDALVKAGFLPRNIQIPSLFNQKLMVQSFGLEHDSLGNPVQHVRYQQDIPREMLRLELTAGRTDLIAGATNLGVGAARGNGPAPYMTTFGAPFLGTPFAMNLERMSPWCRVFLLVALQATFANAENLVPNGYFYVDPYRAILLQALANESGRASWGFMVPRDTALLGLMLFAQGACITPQGVSLSDALQVKVGQ